MSRPSGPPGDGEAGEGRSGDDGEDGSPPEERRGKVDAMAGANQPNPSSVFFFLSFSSSSSRYLALLAVIWCGFVVAS